MAVSRSWTWLASLALCCMASGAQAQPVHHDLLRHQRRPRQGGDLGGLDGADRHCQTLAQAAGAGGKTWRAYLSTQGAGAVNAKDRIGRGPWQNAKGTVIAKDVADLHGANNAINKQNALSEKAEPINGRGDTPNVTTSLLARSRTARLLPAATIAPAATGPRAAPAPRWSATTTAWD